MLFDYSTVTVASVRSVPDLVIADAEEAIAAVVAVDGERTFENTIAPLHAHVYGSTAYGRGPFMARVHPDATVREAGAAAEEVLHKWLTDLPFRDDLSRAIEAFADGTRAAELAGEQRRTLDFWLRDLRRAGHHLPEAQRTELRSLNERLVELSVAFGRNLDEHEDSITIASDDLEGLPPAYVEGLEKTDDGGFLVTMAYPDYFPFMEQSPRRDLRRALQAKFFNRAVEPNRPLLQEAIEIRQRVAALLGFDTWAEYAMELKMASLSAVDAMYESIVPGLTQRGHQELAVLSGLLQEDEPQASLEAWDWQYYDTLQAKRAYEIDRNEVAEYLPLDRVIAGMFEVTGQVFGVDYVALDNSTAWNEDVDLHAIVDRATGRTIAHFYSDLFPREGKFGHAACFTLVGGMAVLDGSYRAPVVAIVANFSRPTASAPALLKHEEALTLFHEFGHVLHNCLTEVADPRFSGVETEWDFVEAPSQIMENWLWEAEVLRRFARHYETGEPIPGDLVDRLVAARDHDVAIKTLRQVMLGKLDLGLHATREPVDIDGVWREAFAYSLLPFPEGTFFPASFGHIMGGYDAGYYGYLWARVYGDDMYSVFADGGLLDPDIGARYRREILSKGGSRDAIEHLRAFLGREPSTRSFLERLGLERESRDRSRT